MIEFMEKDVPWRELGARGRSRQALAAARGLAIGVPPLLVFGGLFVAADAVFKSLLVSAVPNVSGLWIHFAKVAGVGWLSIGLDRMECPAPRS